MRDDYGLELYFCDLEVLRALRNNDLEGLRRIRKGKEGYESQDLRLAQGHYEAFLEILSNSGSRRIHRRRSHPFFQKAIASPELIPKRDESGKIKLYNVVISCAERARRMTEPLNRHEEETDRQFKKRLEHTIAQQNDLLVQAKIAGGETDLRYLRCAYERNNSCLRALNGETLEEIVEEPKQLSLFSEIERTTEAIKSGGYRRGRRWS